MVKHPLIGIVMGSDSDWPVMRACAETFKKFDIPYEAKVLSAHRTPEAALDYAASAQGRHQGADRCGGRCGALGGGAGGQE